MPSNMRIGVIGLGFVGLTLATAVASRGFDVVGVDVDAGRVESIGRGSPPFYEEGLSELLRGVVGGRLRVSTDYSLLRDRDIVFVCVGTPPRPDGSQDQRFLVDAVRRLAGVWRGAGGYRVLAVKSTVVPGTTRRLGALLERESGLRAGEGFGLVSNPEFLREGRALYDTLYPSRVVIGCLDGRSCSVVEGFWREFYRRVGRIPPILTMGLEEAELVKYASNTFLAMRVSFANTIANICERTPGCDVLRVLEAAGLDPRIGRSYLRPGLGYGGSCLPKDVKALIHYSTERGYDPVLVRAIDRVNEEQPLRAIKYLIDEYGCLRGRTIAVLGAAFKPGTSDIRESVSLKIINRLLELGARVKLHDPMALDSVRRIYGDRIAYCRTPQEALEDSDAAIIATEWSEYKSLEPRVFKRLMRRPLVVDGRRIYSPEDFERAGVRIYAIGLSREKPRWP